MSRKNKISNDYYFDEDSSLSDADSQTVKLSDQFSDDCSSIITDDDKYLALLRAYSHNDNEVAQSMIDFLETVTRLKLMRPHNSRKTQFDKMWSDSKLFAGIHPQSIINHVNEEEFDPSGKVIGMIRSAVFAKGQQGVSVTTDFSTTVTGEPLADHLGMYVDPLALAESFSLLRQSVLREPRKRIMKALSPDIQRKYEKKSSRAYIDSLVAAFIKGTLPTYLYADKFSPASTAGIYLPNLDSSGEWLKSKVAALIKFEFRNQFITVFLNDNLNSVSRCSENGYIDCARDEQSLYSLYHHPALVADVSDQEFAWFWRDVEAKISSLASAEFKIAVANGDDPDYQVIRTEFLKRELLKYDYPELTLNKGVVRFSYSDKSSKSELQALIVHSLKSTPNDLLAYPYRIHVMDLAAANAANLDKFQAIVTPDYTKVILVPATKWVKSGFYDVQKRSSRKFHYASPHGTSFIKSRNYKAAQLCVTLYMSHLDKLAVDAAKASNPQDASVDLASVYNGFCEVLAQTKNKKFLALFGSIGNTRMKKMVSRWLRPFSRGRLDIFISGTQTRKGASDLLSHLNVDDEVAADYEDHVVGFDGFTYSEREPSDDADVDKTGSDVDSHVEQQHVEVESGSGLSVSSQSDDSARDSFVEEFPTGSDSGTGIDVSLDQEYQNNTF